MTHVTLTTPIWGVYLVILMLTALWFNMCTKSDDRPRLAVINLYTDTK